MAFRAIKTKRKKNNWSEKLKLLNIFIIIYYSIIGKCVECDEEKEI